MDRLVRAVAAMTSSSRAFPGGLLEEMGVGAGGAQEVLQARPLARHTCRPGHVCAPGSLTPGAGWARCPAPPPAQVAKSQIPRNHQEQARAGVFLPKPDFSAAWPLFHRAFFRPWCWAGV